MQNVSCATMSQQNLFEESESERVGKREQHSGVNCNNPKRICISLIPGKEESEIPQIKVTTNSVFLINVSFVFAYKINITAWKAGCVKQTGFVVPDVSRVFQQHAGFTREGVTRLSRFHGERKFARSLLFLHVGWNIREQSCHSDRNGCCGMRLLLDKIRSFPERHPRGYLRVTS